MLMNPDRGDPNLTFKGAVIELPENPVQIITNFLKLIIEHYPNYFGLIKQFKIVVKAIEGEQFGSEPKGQMKEYFQMIHNLYPKIGLLQTSRDFKYLGIYTS